MMIVIPNWAKWQKHSPHRKNWLALSTSFYSDAKIVALMALDPRAVHIYLWILTQTDPNGTLPMSPFAMECAIRGFLHVSNRFSVQKRLDMIASLGLIDFKTDEEIKQLQLSLTNPNEKQPTLTSANEVQQNSVNALETAETRMALHAKQNITEQDNTNPLPPTENIGGAGGDSLILDSSPGLPPVPDWAKQAETYARQQVKASELATVPQFAWVAGYLAHLATNSQYQPGQLLDCWRDTVDEGLSTAKWSPNWYKKVLQSKLALPYNPAQHQPPPTSAPLEPKPDWPSVKLLAELSKPGAVLVNTWNWERIRLSDPDTTLEVIGPWYLRRTTPSITEKLDLDALQVEYADAG